MARVKKEYQQIMYEMEVINTLHKKGYEQKDIQTILALSNERLQIIHDTLEKWGDTETIRELSGRVFDDLYENKQYKRKRG